MQRLGEVLGQGVGDVDAEAVHAAVGPEAEGLEEVVADFPVGPVQVRLFLGEDVHVPLAGRAVGLGDALPGGAAEDGFPVRRRELAVFALAVAEDVAVAGGGAARGGQGLLEPFVPVRGVVGDDVGDELDARGVQRGGHLVEVRQGAELGVHVAVVVDVVAAVGEGRGVERGEPDGVDPELLQVRDLGGDALDVAQAVTVGVGEAPRVDLVHRCLAPPVGVGGEVGTGQGCQRGGVGQGRFLRVWEGFW